VIASVDRQKSLFAVLAALFLFFIAGAVYTEQYWFIAVPFVILLFYTGWVNRNFIFFLLLFSLPLSFEYNFSPGFGTDIPDEGLMLLTSVIFFAYWVYSPGIISKNSLQHPLLLLFALVLSWTLLTVLFSANQTISLKFLLAKGWYAGAFVLAPLILFRQKKPIIIAATTLTVSLLFVAIITLLRHYNTNFSFATINDALTPFFRNHVNYSAMLVCSIPLLFAFYRLTEKRNLQLFLAGAMIIILVALFFSYARGAWLALLVGVVSYWLLQKRLLFYSYIVVVVLVVGSLFWLKSSDRYLQYAHDYKTTIFHKDFNEHLIATYKLKDVSTAERFYRWIAGVRMIKDNWLTGFGPNTFYDSYRPYTIPAYKTWVSDNRDHSTVHNYFLLTAIEQGIPGLVFLLVLLGAMFYYAQHLYRRITDMFYKTVAATVGVIVVMITAVNFLSDLVETDKTGSLFFLCLSMLIITDINTRPVEPLNHPDSDPSPDI
jgi:O-antigen ligase